MFVRRKDAEREEARRLRAEGMSVKRIAKAVGVSVSSVSVWVRDVPCTVVPPAPPPQEAQPEPAEPEHTKRCPKCDTDLPLSAFNRMKGGHQHWCRDCFRTYFRERGQKHRDQSRAARARRGTAAREHVLAHLRAHPCTDCGEDEILVLEFDHHRGEKLANIAQLVSQAADLGRVKAEIARCEVVCCNCHRRRTAARAARFRWTGIPPRSWEPFQVRNHTYLVEALTARGCLDCGERDPVVLDFDHRGDKVACVSKLANLCRRETLDAEIAKCDVRCANCHRIRTLSSGCWRDIEAWAASVHADN